MFPKSENKREDTITLGKSNAYLFPFKQHFHSLLKPITGPKTKQISWHYSELLKTIIKYNSCILYILKLPPNL